MTNQYFYKDQITKHQLKLFRDKLTPWFTSVARDLPWRRTKDPYKIWLSEIMLQQTRVDQVIPYFNRFITNWPTVTDLAGASLDDVLLAWEGLGYYARARNMHKTAQIVATDLNGVFPDELKAIKALPGIGDYTSAAILSIAFGKKHAVLDGNVFRVISRVFSISEAVNLPKTKKAVQAVVDSLIPEKASGKFNEALMELGATICTPKNYHCLACPIQAGCNSFSAKTVDQFPVVIKKKPIPHYNIAVGIIFNDIGQIYINRRPAEGLLGGLWEFAGGKQESNEPLEETCRRELSEELGIEVSTSALFYTIKHAYTHFKITIHAYPCKIESGKPNPKNGEEGKWVDLADLDNYAFPKANRKLIQYLQAQK